MSTNHNKLQWKLFVEALKYTTANIQQEPVHDNESQHKWKEMSVFDLHTVKLLRQGKGTGGCIFLQANVMEQH